MKRTKDKTSYEERLRKAIEADDHNRKLRFTAVFMLITATISLWYCFFGTGWFQFVIFALSVSWLILFNVANPEVLEDD